MTIEYNQEDNTVTIPSDTYRTLLNQSDFLDCLMACGVDNWDGYSDAQGMMGE